MTIPAWERTWEYNWLHVPTKQQGIKSITFGAYYPDLELRVRTEGDVQRLLNYWNSKQPGTWQYWK